MNPAAIILGETDGILRLPKAPLRNPNNWTQLDSDVIAHLIQVQSQIQNSRWNKSDIRFATEGEQVVNHSFPEFEDFVFAAVYIRQLIAKNDLLLKDAADRYCNFVDCTIKAAWVRNELNAFEKIVDGNAFMMHELTVNELFEAFMYGAGLLHKIKPMGNKNRERFLILCDRHPRYKVLYSLNISLKLMMNHVGKITTVVHRDYANWLHDYGLPLPDTRWHNNLFDIDTSRGSAE